jgi:hypothetical protein
MPRDEYAILAGLDDDQYWAARNYTEKDEAKKLANSIWGMIRKYYDALPNTTYYMHTTKAFNVFYSAAGWYSPFDASVLGRGGSQGQNVSARINITGSMARSVIALLLEYIPEPDPTPVNTDVKSLEQTTLVKQFLDKFVEESGLKDCFTNCTKLAEIYGMSFCSITYDMHRGPFKKEDMQAPATNPLTGQADGEPQPVLDDKGKPKQQTVMTKVKAVGKDGQEKTHNVPVHVGEITTKYYGPLDVVFDLGRRDANFDWLMVPTDINRWELAARYPEAREQILQYVAKDDEWADVSRNINRYEMERQEDRIANRDLLRIYTCYHKRTDACPDGLVATVLGSELLFEPGPLPYSRIPVIQWEHGHIDRTPYGDSLFHQCLGLQDTYDDIFSSILTNLTAFSKQLVMIPRTADFSVSELTDGLAALEYDDSMMATGGQSRPEGLQLVKIAPEAFHAVEELLPKVCMDIVGLNQATRGSPPPSWSGTLNEQVKQMALSYQNEAHNNMLRAVKESYNLMLEILQNFSSEPLVIELAGVNGQKLVRSFTQDDFRQVRRVDVKLGEAFLKDTEAKLEAARELGRLGLVDAEGFLEVQSTGSLASQTDDDLALERSIKAEEESIRAGGAGTLQDGQPHHSHLVSHLKNRATYDVDDPEDAAALARLDAHIGQTLNKYRQVAQMAPEMLEALHQPMPVSMQPPPPPGGAPSGPQPPKGAPGPNPGGRPPPGQAGGPVTETGNPTNAKTS